MKGRGRGPSRRCWPRPPNLIEIMDAGNHVIALRGHSSSQVTTRCKAYAGDMFTLHSQTREIHVRPQINILQFRLAEPPEYSIRPEET